MMSSGVGCRQGQMQAGGQVQMGPGNQWGHLGGNIMVVGNFLRLFHLLWRWVLVPPTAKNIRHGLAGLAAFMLVGAGCASLDGDSLDGANLDGDSLGGKNSPVAAAAWVAKAWVSEAWVSKAWAQPRHKKIKELENANVERYSDPGMNRGLAQIIALAEKGQLNPFNRNSLDETIRRIAPDLATVENRVLIPYLQWVYLTRKKVIPKISEIEQFVAAHPYWPQQNVLRERAETSMVANASDADFLAFADDHPPVTKAGIYRLIRAAMERGKSDQAAEVARRFWVSADFTTNEELAFLQNFQSLLTPADFDQRMEYLLWRQMTRAAFRDLKLVSPLTRQVANIRLQLQAQKPDIDKIMAGLPSSAYSDGLNFDRINWYRRKGNLRQAREIFANMMPPPPHLADRWWVARYAMARSALRDGKYDEAYRLVNEHMLSKKSDDYGQAEFYAGWIALTLRKDAETARLHFQNIYSAATVSYSRARGAYWLGRTAEILGNNSDAVAWYGQAASFPISFYGQIAAERLRDLGHAVPDISAQASPYPLDALEFRAKLGQVENAGLTNLSNNNGDYPLILLDDPEGKNRGRDQAMPMNARLAATQNEITLTVRRLLALGAREHAEPLIHILAELAQSPSDMVEVGDLALASKRAGLAVWVARKAQARFGSTLETTGYPVLEIALEKGVESALIHSLIRQESSFLPHAKSRVGARGLMQLMPGTAKDMARQLRIPYARAKLVDVNFNLRLGGAYLKQLLQTYKGDYVLAVAAYNAGPSRVNAWLDELGDPRETHQDVVAWIEQIPFSETRIYVQRVLEGLKVYRRLLPPQNQQVNRDGLPFTVLSPATLAAPPPGDASRGDATRGDAAAFDAARGKPISKPELAAPPTHAKPETALPTSEAEAPPLARPGDSLNPNPHQPKLSPQPLNNEEASRGFEAVTPLPPPISSPAALGAKPLPPLDASRLCDRDCLDAQTFANLNSEN
ncbi:MAG: transglycosylase SLT domain-containing protein [Candidatus Symbiobacter sp.]|nr:transglycosylase SLT domain-containing protein [Candidatus Symbiobacter sp.]